MMNKFTFVCCLAGSLTLSAYAEVGDKITSLELLSNDKCYTITPGDNSRGTWYYNSKDPAHLYSTYKVNVTVDQNDQNQQFAFLKSSSGKYYVYSVGGKKFLSYSSDVVALSDQVTSENFYTTFEATTGDTYKDYPWVVALNGHHVGISSGYTYGVITHYNSTNDGGNCISITEAGSFESTELLKQIEISEKIIEANRILKAPQRAVGGCDPEAWSALNEICGGDGVADATDVAKEGFQDALTAAKASTGLTFSNNKVYKIQNYTASNGYIYSKKEDNASRIFSSSKQNDLTPVENSEYWQVCSAKGYTVLYNVGTKSYAQYDASKNYWVLSSEPAFMNIQSNESKGIAAYSIQDTRYTGNQQYMHISNGGYETGVVGYGTNADASNFYFVEQSEMQADNIDIEPFILKKSKEDARAIINSYDATKSNYIGNYRQEDINTLKTLVEASTTSYDDLEAAIKVAQSSTKQPEAGKYYIIQNTMAFSDGGAKAIYENPDGTNIAWRTVSQAPAELWQFESDGNGHYYIKSANTGKYLQLNLGAMTGTLVAENGSAFTLEPKDNSTTLALINYIGTDRSTLILKTGNTWNDTAKPENESGNFVGTYNDFGENIATKWNVIEATDVKIGISDAEYATVWLPYAVNLDGTNVKAYTIDQIKDGYATLKGIEGNILPAKSAVILHGEQGSYDLAIEPNDEQASVESNLEGTAIATTIDANTNAYILGNGSKGLGFYQMDGTDRTMAANKAYLVLPQEAKGIRSIIFSDGTTTGIESTVAEGTEAEEYYDLQGRRVMNPTKGIYVTKSGKKVIINK